MVLLYPKNFMMLALLSSADQGSVPCVRALGDLRQVQREASAAFRLAMRPCECTRRILDWHMLGMADYLMEEVLIAKYPQPIEDYRRAVAR